MARAVNAETLSLVKQWEGVRLTAYPDPGSKTGVPWTIGYGHTLGVTKGMKITQAQAEAFLEQDLAKVAAKVDSLVTVSLTDNQFGALVSLVFNIGIEAFEKSTLLKKLNAGDYGSVPTELARWNKNDGKIMQGLSNRRAAEAGLWAKGAYVASNTVDAKPGNPIKDLLKPENITAGGALIGGAGALTSGNGPVQFAVAAIMVLAALTIAFLIIRKATR